MAAPSHGENSLQFSPFRGEINQAGKRKQKINPDPVRVEWR
jgi:hypothetical protein